MKPSSDRPCGSDRGGLAAQVHRRSGRETPGPSQSATTVPPSPVFSPPAVGGEQQLMATLVGALQNPAVQQLLAGAMQNPAVQQLLAGLLGGARQGSELAAPWVGPIGAAGAVMGGEQPGLRHRGSTDGASGSAPAGPSDTGQPPPSVFSLPSLGSSASGARASQDLLSALMGALQNPAVRQLLDLLFGVRQAGGMFTQSATMGRNIYDATLAEANQATDEVSTNEMRRIIKEASAAVFDGRTQLEYSIGHLPGAINVAPKPGVAMSQYVSDVAEIEGQVASRATPIVLYCNGPFCGKSRRLGVELVAAGFTDVRRYQLGTPVWRALVGMMAIEPAGVSYVQRGDRTAAFIDARPPSEYAAGSLARARNVPAGDLLTAKDDGRLPMDDFNTRVVVFGRDGGQAETMAEALVGQGFTNVKYYDGAFTQLLAAVS